MLVYILGKSKHIIVKHFTDGWVRKKKLMWVVHSEAECTQKALESTQSDSSLTYFFGRTLKNVYIDKTNIIFQIYIRIYALFYSYEVSVDISFVWNYMDMVVNITEFSA